MIPAIGLILSVEMIRDGGSLAAAFQVLDGSVYWLFFKIKLRPLPGGGIKRVGYLTPTVVDRLIGTAVEISWQHANILLSQMRPLVRHDSDLAWLETMAAVAEGQGKLPPSIVAVLFSSAKKP